jgi:hypothetical protein
VSRRASSFAPKHIPTPAESVAQVLRFDAAQSRARDANGMIDHAAAALATWHIRAHRDVTLDGERIDLFTKGAAAAILVMPDATAAVVLARAERIARLSRVAEVIIVTAVGRLGYMPTAVAGKPLHVVHLARPA